jgi:hypothetical protein
LLQPAIANEPATVAIAVIVKSREFMMRISSRAAGCTGLTTGHLHAHRTMQWEVIQR